jgi:DNA-binding TFAR19-related protein (PDSD5 family)
VIIFKVNTLALTKPEKAQAVENHLCQMARSGQLMNKFGEEQLISLLGRISEQNQKKTIVNVNYFYFHFYRQFI